MVQLTIDYICAATSPPHYPCKKLPEFAVLGRSNVGKSSLINTLAGGRKIARISKTPGKTRLLHFFQVDNDFLLVDLPGYGFARVPLSERDKWEKMATKYLLTRAELVAVVLLIDSRHSATKLDLQMISWLQKNTIPFIVIATKIDKIPKGKQRAVPSQLVRQLNITSSDIELIPFSARTAQGKKELIKLLFSKARSHARDRTGNSD